MRNTQTAIQFSIDWNQWIEDNKILSLKVGIFKPVGNVNYEVLQAFTSSNGKEGKVEVPARFQNDFVDILADEIAGGEVSGSSIRETLNATCWIEDSFGELISDDGWYEVEESEGHNIY